MAVELPNKTKNSFFFSNSRKNIAVKKPNVTSFASKCAVTTFTVADGNLVRVALPT